ncbi:MAG: hypothetical protein KF782_02075 [Labilithrix sp.]|nr:hypothetical protein [Labilithrix sp.]
MSAAGRTRGGGVIGALTCTAGARARTSAGRSSEDTVAPSFSIRGRCHSMREPW